MKKQLIRFIALAFVLVALFSFTGCDNLKGVTVDDIKAYGKLVVATDPNFHPFEYIENNKVVGWDMDIAKEFADALDVDLQIKDMDFDIVLSSVQKGTVHVGMAGISRTPDREKTLDFTDAVIDSSQVIIVRTGETAITDAMSLAGKKVGVGKGYIGEQLANMEDIAYEDGNPILGKPSEVLPYNDAASAVKALADGHVDAVIMDKYPAEMSVSKTSGTKILDGSIYDDAYCFVVQKGNSSLLDFLNEQIKKLQDNGKMAAITAKYFG